MRQWKAAKNLKLFFRFISCNRIIKTIEHRNILNLLNESSNSGLVTINWRFVSGQLCAIYRARNVIYEIIYSTEVLESSFSEDNRVYILVRGLSLL